MIHEEPEVRGSTVARLAPWVIFCALGLLTVVVWRQQIENQHQLRRRHTEDVCVQASRRLEVFIESRLTIAALVAHRWASDPNQDYSRHHFEEFATLIVEDLPGYHGMSLVPPQRDRVWLVPPTIPSVLAELGPRHHRLMDQSERENRAVLSEPITTETGTKRLFAVQSLTRGDDLLGFLFVEFDVDRLMERLFHGRIRSEFNFRIEEDDRVLYTHVPDGTAEVFDSVSTRASQPFSLANRRWRLTAVPRVHRAGLAAWRTNLAVPLLGFLLSLGISGLVFALTRRIDRQRAARDRALTELEARKKAEDALRESEARYHSVFDAAKNGLMVLDDDGVVVEANRAAAEMHGYAPGQLEGRSAKDLIEPNHWHQFDRYFGQLKRRDAVLVDLVDVTADGATIDVELRGTSFRHGDQRRVLVIVADVSERKRAHERHALLSRKALMAQEDERARVSRDLHDELGQLLTAVGLELELAEKRARPSNGCASAVGNAVALVEKAAEELRRICMGLRPPLLDDLGIGPAAELLINEFTERTGIETRFDLQLPDEARAVPAETSLAVYRILQEALNNASRHADARHVDISLIRAAGELRLVVHDDGQGFVLDPRGADTGSGIVGMQERATLVAGELDVRSAPGDGTRVELCVQVPIRAGEVS